MTPTGHLRSCGISTPTFRKDSWEVDWDQRQGKTVWARNPSSKMPASRDWHWVHYKTLSKSGTLWRHADRSNRPSRRKTYVNDQGYVLLGRGDMTEEEVRFAEQYGLFTLNRKTICLEHRFRMAVIVGGDIGKQVVRHINGVKTDNRPENLILGTVQENNMDHNTARLAAIYWRNKYENLRAGHERELLPPPQFA